MASTILIRPNEPDTSSRIAQLCLEAREESALGAQLCANELEQITRQLEVFSIMPGTSLFVAERHGEVAGFALVRLLKDDVLHGGPAVFVEGMYVARDFRRHGVGRALMAQVASLAVTEEAVDVYAQPLPGARGTQRFLARLGFAPAGTHRVVGVAALQRELARDASGRGRSGRTLEDLIARRRRSRSSTNSGPVDIRRVSERLGS